VMSALIAVAVAFVGLGTAPTGAGFVVSAAAQAPAVPASTEQNPLSLQDAVPTTLSSASSTVRPDLVDMAAAEREGMSRPVLDLALSALTCAIDSGDISTPPTLTVIDYSRPSTEARLWVFDLRTGGVRFHELVAHGKGTGENLAEHFSDDMNSHQSSLGLFVTGDTYTGNNGYSLRLNGLEPGFNSRARERAIVIHGASYVDAEFAAKQGRLGRSWGCPALREAIAHDVIDFVRDGGVIFSYYPDEAWLERSRFLHCDQS